MTTRRTLTTIALCAALLPVFSSAANADDGKRVKGKKLETLTTVEAVRTHGRDDQYAELVGRFTARLGKEDFTFEDATGTILAELDDDRDWTFAKDQRVRVRAEVERDDGEVSIEVMEVIPE